jgi:hypothetical protein
MKYKVATPEAVNAMVWGLFNPEHPVPMEIQAKFLEAYDSADNFWTPEKGLSMNALLNINGGGWKLDHPLMLKVFGQSINGVKVDFESPAFQKELARAHEIAMGVPREFSQWLQEITWKILDEEFAQRYSQYGHREHVPVGEKTEIEKVIKDLQKKGIKVGGKWTDLTDKSLEVIPADVRAKETQGVMDATYRFLRYKEELEEKAA